LLQVDQSVLHDEWAKYKNNIDEHQQKQGEKQGEKRAEEEEERRRRRRKKKKKKKKEEEEKEERRRRKKKKKKEEEHVRETRAQSTHATEHRWRGDTPVRLRRHPRLYATTANTHHIVWLTHSTAVTRAPTYLW
jgi:hypothetical protein